VKEVHRDFRRFNRKTIFQCIVAFFFCAIASQAVSATYPERPIRIICGSGAGGIVDITARILAERMSANLGQPVVIENMPGAGSTIAIKAVERSDPDGYTLLFSGAAISVVPALYPDSHIDVLNDLKPVSAVGDTPLLLFVNKAVPGNNFKAVIDYLKANPNKTNSGSNGRGTGSYLAMALFKKLAGVNVVNVMYRSTPQVLSDLVAGRIGMAFSADDNSILQSPTIRPIAITGRSRSSKFPRVSTFDELGLKGLESGSPTMLLAPKDTPQPILAMLSKAVEKSLASPEMAKRLSQAGIVRPEQTGPGYARTFLRSEVAKWGEILRESPK